MPAIGKNNFVQGRRIKRQLIGVLKFLANIVGVQNRGFRRLFQSLRAIGEDVAECPNMHAELAAKSFHLADRSRSVEIERIHATIFQGDNGKREKRLEYAFHSDRAGSRAATTVR